MTITVAQAAASLVNVGDLQESSVDLPLPQPVGVLVRDRLGAPVGGRAVTFTVAEGGGRVAPPTATSGADGIARTAWTLGTVARAPQAIDARLGALASRITATSLAGVPASMRVVRGADQSGSRNTAVAVAPAVRVADRFDNPVVGILVTFTVTGGGGRVTNASVSTDVSGIATVGSFVLGLEEGPNTLLASVAGIAGATISATGTTAIPLGSLVIVGGENEAGIAGQPVVDLPAVLVRTAAGDPAAGVPVRFTIRSGGGTVSGADAQTDASGIARVGSWRLGATPAPNSLGVVATAPNFPTTPLVFNAVACSANTPLGYSISVCFTTEMTASQRAAFASAAARWAAAITGDIPDFAPALDSLCGSALAINQGIDDLTILASIEAIDGPGAVLGQAGPCLIRSASGFPLVGRMQFDAADVATLEQRGQFESVILHEMGHVLGIGTLWQFKGLLRLPSSDTLTRDTHFVGQRATAAFDLAGGTTYTGLKVPVENLFGGGTRNSHWRESVLRNELMTGFLNANTANPLSGITIGSLGDMGYTVDPTVADLFTFSAALQANGSRSGVSDALTLRLVNDLYTGPVHTASPDGRRRRIR